MRSALAVGLSLALGTACWAAGKVVRGKPNPGKASVKVGQTFTVELEGNLTTGFEWVVAKVDAKMLAVGERLYTSKPAPRGKLGVGGTFFFPVKALKAGKTELALEYRRPWEKVPASETFTVKVSIAAKK